MMPNDQRALQLRNALLSAFPTRSALAEMLRLRLNVVLDHVAGEQNLAAAVLQVIEWAEAQGRTRALIAAARRANPGNPALQAIRFHTIATAATATAGLQGPRPEGGSPDPFGAYLLKGRPFLDRRVLRDHLRRLADGSAEILVVSGPPGSGRSYSWELIVHVAAALETIRLVRVNVEPGLDGGQFGPQALAERLGIYPPDLGANVPAGASRTPGVIATWLVNEFAGSGEQWWIVLDGFEHRDLPRETRDLLDGMMVLVSAPEHRGRLGLILLAYDESRIPESVRPFVLVEQLGPLTRDDVGSFFETYFRDAGQTITAADIDRLVDEILNEAERDRSPADTSGIARVVALVVRKLERNG